MKRLGRRGQRRLCGGRCGCRNGCRSGCRTGCRGRCRRLCKLRRYLVRRDHEIVMELRWKLIKLVKRDRVVGIEIELRLSRLFGLVDENGFTADGAGLGSLQPTQQTPAMHDVTTRQHATRLHRFTTHDAHIGTIVLELLWCCNREPSVHIAGDRLVPHYERNAPPEGTEREINLTYEMER